VIFEAEVLISSYNLPGTNKRVAAMRKPCPLFIKLLPLPVRLAFDKSASSRIIFGDFPPSSSVYVSFVSTASFAIILTWACKEIFCNIGLRLISAPTASPKPLTINAPFGNPAH